MSFIYVAGLWKSDVTFRGLLTTMVISFYPVLVVSWRHGDVWDD